MSRPIKGRKVCCLPENSNFGPLDKNYEEIGCIKLTIDEYETIRLIDFERFTQEECAKQMDIARTTVQKIYNEARMKIAEALVNGKKLRIEGGKYRLCDGMGCGKSSGCRKMNLKNNDKNDNI